jgi:hypothetical protein
MITPPACILCIFLAADLMVNSDATAAINPNTLNIRSTSSVHGILSDASPYDDEAANTITQIQEIRKGGSCAWAQPT